MSKLRKNMPPPTTRIPDKKKEANKKICREKIEFDSDQYIGLKNDMIRAYVDRLIPCKECGHPIDPLCAHHHGPTGCPNCIQLYYRFE